MTSSFCPDHVASSVSVCSELSSRDGQCLNTAGTQWAPPLGKDSWPRSRTEAQCSDTAIVATTGTRAKKAGPLPPTSKRGVERCSRRSWGQAPPPIPVPWIWMASPGNRSWQAERRMCLLAKGMGDLTAVPCPTLTSDAVSGWWGGGHWWLGCKCSLSCKLFSHVRGCGGGKRLVGAVGSAARSGGDIAQAQCCPGTC